MDKGSELKKPKVINMLKYYREKLGVTGKEMEWRTNIGAKHWPHYEAGREPKVKLAQRFARVLKKQNRHFNITSFHPDFVRDFLLQPYEVLNFY